MGYDTTSPTNIYRMVLIWQHGVHEFLNMAEVFAYTYNRLIFWTFEKNQGVKNSKLKKKLKLKLKIQIFGTFEGKNNFLTFLVSLFGKPNLFNQPNQLNTLTSQTAPTLAN